MKRIGVEKHPPIPFLNKELDRYESPVATLSECSSQPSVTCDRSSCSWRNWHRRRMPPQCRSPDPNGDPARVLELAFDCLRLILLDQTTWGSG